MEGLLGILLALAIAAVVGLSVAHRLQLRALRALRRSDRDRTVELRKRLASESARRNELEALLGSMAEGVLAVDLECRVLNLNRAGADLLRIGRDQAVGRRLHEVVRQRRIQELLETTLAGAGAAQDEFELPIPGDSLEHPGTIQAQTAPLQDGEGQPIGALVVMHDVTQVRRLESVRQEFVANVSHEVKTPVAAIKAAVETLLDDRDGTMGRSDRENFQRMIARQADRLDSIVEDLLALARIEQEPSEQPEQMPLDWVAPVLSAAIETCQPKADEKGVLLEMACEHGLLAMMRPNLIEQAVVNLVDNAIKYSDAGARVGVSAEHAGSQAVITVRDEGRGIESRHLPRIFERFYRTDRSRSRSMGGTGLGLSIVKHIAAAHGGRVGVESRVGEGSVFRLYLRLAADAKGYAGPASDVAGGRTEIPPAA